MIGFKSLTTYICKINGNSGGVFEGMTTTMYDLSICLKIETEESIDSVTEILGQIPTCSIKKGERLSRVLEPAESNIWMYDVKYRDCKDNVGLMSNFLGGIKNIFQRIESIKAIGNVTIRVSVVSDFAQLGIGFSEEELLLLSSLQIPLEISVLSWGMCIDE